MALHEPVLTRIVPLALALVLVACAEGDTGPAGTGTGLVTTDGVSTGDGGTTDGTTDGNTASGTSGATGASTTGGSTDGTDGSAGTTGDTGADTDGGLPTGPDTKFDVGAIPDAGDVCGGGSGGLEFSYIWIANSPQGTVSKIDTRKLLEEGRYTTGPAGAGNPSRTSVSLGGDVAVVNREGGITKIWAVPQRCKDTNNNGMIDTSTGPNDILPWGQDECVAWNTPLGVDSRPAAWTAGEEIGEDECGSPIFGNEKVWASAPEPGNASSRVYLIDGDTGTIDDEVVVPVGGSYGIYGGAVDQDNDLWGVSWSAGPLVHVRFADLTHEIIELPNPSAYGFTVDGKGRVWIGGFSGVLQRYDPATQSWAQVNLPNISSLSRGMMEDQNGQLWIAALSPSGILHVDTDSATFAEFLDSSVLPGVGTPTGASVDIDGIVWMVDQTKDGGGSWVYDPVMKSVQWMGGLVGPYTYSDMTGWALKNVANPSG